MEMFYKKGYVCYLRASQMNGLIEQSVNDVQAFNRLKRIATAYQRKQKELESRHFSADNGLLLHSTLFSNEMFITYVHVKKENTGIEEDELRLILNDIQELLAYFRHEGITLEGGLSYDNVYHSGNMIIGPAVVKAVIAKPKSELGIWLDMDICKFIENNDAFESYVSGRKVLEICEEIAT